MADPETSRFPLWLKLAYTAWVVALVPVWVPYQGWNNFLWLSDIAFFMTCLALWTENRFVTSMAAVGIILPDGAWILYFLARLTIDAGPFEQTGYMFDESLPLYVRGLSLFHVVLPPLLLWMTYRVGYDRRALWAQTLLAWPVLLISYFFTDPAESINMVHGFGEPPSPPIAQPWWLISEIVLLPLAVYLPTHYLLRRWTSRSASEG